MLQFQSAQRDHNMTAEAILESLEIVVERVGDPAPQIYAKLFAQNPQLEEMFILDRDGAVRAEMLRLSFDAIIDLSRDGHYAKGLILDRTDQPRQ